MMGTTHITTGVSAAAWATVPLAALGVQPLVLMLSIPVGAYAALVPDWDHHGSRITWSLPPLSNLVSWTLRGGPLYLEVPVFHYLLVDVRIFPWYFGHRRGLHTEEAALVFGLVLGAPFYFLPAPLGGFLGAGVFSGQITVGCLTHLWGDMRTVGGLRKRGGAPRDRRTIGNTFEVGSPYEYYLRDRIYRPFAIASVIVAVVAMAYFMRTG